MSKMKDIASWNAYIYICQDTDWNLVQFRTGLVRIEIPNCPSTDWNPQNGRKITSYPLDSFEFQSGFFLNSRISGFSEFLRFQ